MNHSSYMSLSHLKPHTMDVSCAQQFHQHFAAPAWALVPCVKSGRLRPPCTGRLRPHTRCKFQMQCDIGLETAFFGGRVTENDFKKRGAVDLRSENPKRSLANI